MNRRELIDELLQQTSRTFALAIPLLPEPQRLEVGVGYLLFRIADTLEDAERLDRDARIAALADWIELLRHPKLDQAEKLANQWTGTPPSDSEAYNRLLSETPAVIVTFLELSAAAQATISGHAIRSAEGMIETLASADTAGHFRLESIDSLRRYCYFVAGIVGEMLTELFQPGLNPSVNRAALATDGAAFGEGLQLVNILKDASEDARDGRVYLPAAHDRADVMAIARADLIAAERYAENLQAAGADQGVLAFVTLPRTLAEATLTGLETGVNKVSRAVVTEKLAHAEAIRSSQGA